jgi:uncharacterized membrane protein/protein-disulfide isomerase
MMPDVYLNIQKRRHTVFQDSFAGSDKSINIYGLIKKKSWSKNHRKMSNFRSEKPLPFAIYFSTVILLGLIGLGNSIYLAISHYRVHTDIGYSSFCAISRALNCDTVSQSPYSIFMSLPVPVWGIIGFVFFLLMAAVAANKDANKKRPWALLICLSFFFSLYSIILALISTFVINSYCLMCIVGYAISFMLLFYTWLTRKRFKHEPFFASLKKDTIFLWQKRKIALSLLVPFLIGSVAVAALMPAYWQIKFPRASADLSMGITADGHPWIGAENPELVITEFADYQCFQCKKMHFFLRQLISDHPEKIRLVHRHFPMDHEVNPLVKAPFHIGSGKLALLSIAAAKLNKFWQLNDTLYSLSLEKESIDVEALAEKIGVDSKELVRLANDIKTRKQLHRDIRDGLRLKINGTPAYVIDEKLYLSQIPPGILTTIMK